VQVKVEKLPIVPEVSTFHSVQTASHRRPCRNVPAYKQVLFAIAFFLLFLLTDGSSAASQHWEGAPPTYLPAGLAVAVLVYGGVGYAPVLFISGLVAALLNYHRHFFAWCGLPGVIGIYIWYAGAAVILRRHWRIDPHLQRVRDVGRYLLVFLVAEVLTAITGMLTLWGDGYISRDDGLRTVMDWLGSDAISILTFTPFLLVVVAPCVSRWMRSPTISFSFVECRRALSRGDIVEISAQFLCILAAIWIVFGFSRAAPYQPLYLLFIPLIWVAVKRGLPGATLTTFAINLGLTSAACLTHVPRGSLPRLQLAMISLGFTSLCLGAVVTQGKRSDRDLRQSEAGLREAQRVGRLGSWTFDVKTGRVTWTDELYRIVGFDPSLPPPLFAEQERLLTQESWQRLTAQFEMTLLTGISCELELEIVRPDRTTVWIMIRGERQQNERGEVTGMCGIAQDVTQSKRAEQKVQFLAYYDALTGLPNRILLRDRLTQALASARRRNERVGLLFLDLDRFKIINDSLGHSVGDLLLHEVATRLKEQTRDQDTVARVGGDEFLIVLNGLGSRSDAAVAGKRIVNAMASDFLIQGRSLKISCSLGICVSPEHGDDAETLITNADAAMYGAKENGRNRYRFFTSEMNAHVLERSTLERGLRTALDNHELSLMYQPQVHIGTGRIVGLEALLRWKHPDLGSVPPDKFIRVAENSGLIIPIGEWVLRTACFQVRDWHMQGLPRVCVAVNVSAIQFRQEGFREMIKKILRESNLAPQFLELELTESLLTKNADVVFAVMQDLRDMGLKLAIDDFGTGYSSLSYLRQFPVSKLKIDRSFIRDVATNTDAAVIATAIIGLAKGLNLKVIAEGVETGPQLAFLQARQCDEMQGYYFSKPLLVDEVGPKLTVTANLVSSATDNQ
jgi:diguanylate cyclase (GGDEF)-like protein